MRLEQMLSRLPAVVIIAMMSLLGALAYLTGYALALAVL